MENSQPIYSKEMLEKEKKALAIEIKEHKAKALRHQQQIKMFMRQGLSDLPEKQQLIHETLELEEKALKERLEELERRAKDLNP